MTLLDQRAETDKDVVVCWGGTMLGFLSSGMGFKPHDCTYLVQEKQSIAAQLADLRRPWAQPGICVTLKGRRSNEAALHTA